MPLIKLTCFTVGKTNPCIVNLNWDNRLLEKILSLYLTQEAIREEKWFSRLQGLESIVEFLILHLPEDKEKNITIITIIPNKKIKIHHTPGELGEEREINTINLTEPEFIQEFIKAKPDFIAQINQGKILFGQDKFIQLMKQMHLRDL